MDYIPREDANALIWLQSFATGIQNSPSTYMLSAADSTAISDAVQQFADAMAVASLPSSRTVETINIKDTKRNAAETLCRHYAVEIKVNNAIDDNAKLAIGVRPVNESREPIHCPQTSPMINTHPGNHGAEFSGQVNRVEFDAGTAADDHNHLITAEERFQVAMAKQ